MEVAPSFESFNKVPVEYFFQPLERLFQPLLFSCRFYRPVALALCIVVENISSVLIPCDVEFNLFRFGLRETICLHAVL